MALFMSEKENPCSSEEHYGLSDSTIMLVQQVAHACISLPVTSDEEKIVIIN